jgi:thiamine-monophosphate kinase
VPSNSDLYSLVILKAKIHLLGGDTNRSSSGITINVTLLGKIENKYIKRRSAAKLGDIICVTDFLGDSAGGLKFILDKFYELLNI